MNVGVINKSGDRKNVKLGFSWTFLLFGWWVPVFRLDLKWAVIFFVSTLIAVSIDPAFSTGVSAVGGFIYNRLYAKDLVDGGYHGATEIEDIEFKEYAAENVFQI